MSEDADATEGPAVDVVCLGECLVMFVPEQPESARKMLGPHVPTVAGAESNVAAHVASLGLRSAWLSRVGMDPFGDFVLAQLEAYGVDVAHVRRDDSRATGVAFKEISTGGTSVHYYRRESAATAMDVVLGDTARTVGGRVLHLSGVTPALSPSCERLVVSLARDRPSGSLLSFDVNWRPALWRDRDPSVLLSLARSSDIVFVGEDEARSLWSTDGLRGVRKLLPDVETLVIKQGSRGATVIGNEVEVFIPALEAEVVEVVGAGDAFAAGFLVGTLAGRSLLERGRLGTILAASTLRVSSDIGVPPPTPEIEALLALTEEEWATASWDGPRAGG